jgi:hypothetical protein
MQMTAMNPVSKAIDSDTSRELSDPSNHEVVTIESQDLDPLYLPTKNSEGPLFASSLCDVIINSTVCRSFSS